MKNHLIPGFSKGKGLRFKPMTKRKSRLSLRPLLKLDLGTIAFTFSGMVHFQESFFVYLLFYVAFNSQGHIATGSLRVEETSAYCTVNHRASESNYQLSNMKSPARDSNWRPQRLEAKTLTTTPPSPLFRKVPVLSMSNNSNVTRFAFFCAKFRYSATLQLTIF